METKSEITQYSAFEMIDLIVAICSPLEDVSEEKQKDMKLALSYVKREHEWMLGVLMRQTLPIIEKQEEFIKRYGLQTNHIFEIILPKSPPSYCRGVYTAAEASCILPESLKTVENLEEFIGYIKVTLFITKKSQLKFLYLLIRMRLKGDLKTDKEIHKLVYSAWYCYTSELGENFSKVSPCLDDQACVDLHIADSERVSPNDASLLVRGFCYSTDMERNKMVIQQYYEDLENAFKIVRWSDLPVFFELVKRKIKLHEMDQKHILLHKFSEILRKFTTKYQLKVFKVLEEASEAYQDDLSDIGQFSAFDVYTIFEESQWLLNDYETFILTVLTTVSMVKQSDLKLLYAMILQGVVIRHHRIYYVDNVKDFKGKCLMAMVQEQLKSPRFPMDSARNMIALMPDVDICPSQTYSAAQIFMLVPSQSFDKDLSNLQAFLNGIRYVKEFVHPSEMGFLKLMMESYLRGPIKQLLNREKLGFEDLPDALTYIYNTKKLRININLLKSR